MLEFPTYIRLIKKKSTMMILSENKQRIHDVLISDLQRRLFKQYNARKEEWNISDEDYEVQQTLLVDRVLHCDTLNDVNELVLDYTDVFDDYDSINVFTLEGTMNYIFKLLR
tara:strand:- start:62 stop:397 length:336 start_codon:yes stop_codon:yes gene_type:complete